MYVCIRRARFVGKQAGMHTYSPYPDVFVIRVVQGVTATATLVNKERTLVDTQHSMINDQ